MSSSCGDHDSTRANEGRRLASVPPPIPQAPSLVQLLASARTRDQQQQGQQQQQQQRGQQHFDLLLSNLVHSSPLSSTRPVPNQNDRSSGNSVQLLLRDLDAAMETTMNHRNNNNNNNDNDNSINNNQDNEQDDGSDQQEDNDTVEDNEEEEKDDNVEQELNEEDQQQDDDSSIAQRNQDAFR